MNTNRNTELEAFELPGDRLNYILDQIGFKQGRGRVADFQNYLAEKSPSVFTDLKYTTVRSWFQEHSPPMRKIDAIIKTLQIDYTFHLDISQIKTWWKIGGSFPFTKKHEVVDTEITNDDQEKLEFLVMSLLIEEAGGNSKSFDTNSLIAIKNYILKFAKDFADPQKTTCPEDILRRVIRSKLSDLS